MRATATLVAALLDAGQYDVSEADFTAAVLALARECGWKAVHFRAAMTRHGWRTPVQGDGENWPDIVAVRKPRKIAAELKAETGRVREGQLEWLDLLAACGDEAYLWRPSDWRDIRRILE